MGQANPPREHYSYLLRLVRAGEPDNGWRIRLQDARSGQTRYFNGLAELLVYLESELDGSSLPLSPE